MTQKEMIKRHLEDVGFITSWDAYREYGITQLGARIFELKEQGLKIETEQQSTVNRYGKKTKFTKYSVVQ